MRSTLTIFLLTILHHQPTLASPTSQPFLATFDTLPKVNGAATAFVPTPYVHLNWTSFFVASRGNSVLVTPHSEPAASLAGDPYEPTSTISVGYVGSKVRAFDLLSSWVACATFNNLPSERCVARFTGYKANGWATRKGSGGTASASGPGFAPASPGNRSVTFDYAFSGDDVMEFVRFPGSFRGLEAVEVVLGVQGSEFGQVVQLDDVKGRVHW